ncbi:MAG: exosome complex exonuclease Rrp41, partial [Candidatus Thermoplasmatota archaeon]|nr:exosome complex exonuclease Rrp41 [Candidatus Thermoplasmatota archaeon]
KNKILAAVYGPRECHPRHLQDPTRAIVQCNYNMLSFSVDDRKRPGPDRRSVEISKILSEALEHVVFLEQFPRTSIDVYIVVLQANAGTRCAGLTAASVALADAGIPMRDLVPACAAGKVADTIVLDLNKEEDNFGQADVPLAYLPRTGEILLLQMDGHMTQEEFDRAIELAMDGCSKIYALQQEALKRKYSVILSEEETKTEEAN